MLNRYQDALGGLEEAGRLRSLSPNHGIDFSSNDYLALSQASAIRQALTNAVERGVPVGSGGSRLLRGNHQEHERLESKAAQFFGSDRSLFLGSGYIANFALLTALPQRGDLVAYDSLVHASCHEGMRAGRAEYLQARHNDVEDFEFQIISWRKKGGRGRVWIAVESLYSMDGDQAPLADLVVLADRHDAFLLIDEAHATGVFGPNGRGLAAEYEGSDNIISIHTCGKALGAEGALVCAPEVICKFLINRCRPFIFSTAPSPLMAVAVSEALELLVSEPQRRIRLMTLIDHAQREMDRLLSMQGSHSQIIPIIVGDNQKTMQLAQQLRDQGYDVRGIRPPTVPENTARLRLSITLHINQQQITEMLQFLAEAWQR